ncbi:MAG: hypothetical protein ACRDZQ_11500, partial [Acidimicrobiales bacterium]
MLAAGLVCFALWTVADAPSLQRSARAAPIGARRSAALAVLGPLATVSRALRMDRPVAIADGILGRPAPGQGSSLLATAAPGPRRGPGSGGGPARLSGAPGEAAGGAAHGSGEGPGDSLPAASSGASGRAGPGASRSAASPGGASYPGGSS